MSSTNDAATVIQSISATIGSSFVIYLSVTLRKGVRKFMREHQGLIEQTKQNTEDIRQNQIDIKRILDILQSEMLPKHRRR